MSFAASSDCDEIKFTMSGDSMESLAVDLVDADSAVDFEKIWDESVAKIVEFLPSVI